MEDTGRRFRGLLLDYGGVMTTSMAGAFARFAMDAGVDPATFKAVIDDAYGGRDSQGMVAGLERGTTSVAAFERWLAERLSPVAARPVEATGLRERLFAGMEPDLAMADAVGRARAAAIRTGLVSNSWGDSGYERERFGELFDVVVISAEVGMRKPDREIFLFAAEQLGLPSEECVFVDDLLHNAEGARAVGMEALVHRSAELTIPRLEGLFGVVLQPDG